MPQAGVFHLPAYINRRAGGKHLPEAKKSQLKNPNSTTRNSQLESPKPQKKITLTKEQFKYLYEKHGRAIRNYLYYRSGDGAVADDITQEMFLKVWEKQFKYEPEKIKSLLYKIAGELFLNYIRRNKFEADYVDELKFRLKDSTEKTIDNKMLLQKCENALKKLTKKERTVFLMSRKDELKYTEIAEYLNISIKAVEKRMTNALKKLKTK